MTLEQEAHLAETQAQIQALVESKYRDGASKHGGDLLTYGTLTLIDNAIEENLDALVYLLRAKSVLQASQEPRQ